MRTTPTWPNPALSLCGPYKGGDGKWLPSDQFKRTKNGKKRFATCIAKSIINAKYNPVHNPVNNPVNNEKQARLEREAHERGERTAKDDRNARTNLLRACEHRGNRYNCVDCVSFEVAQQQGWICNICQTTRTRSGICRGCFKSALGIATLRVESLVVGALQHLIPGIGECTKNRRGGSGCQDQIGGNDCNGDDAPATKSALPDLELILSRPLCKPSVTKAVQANQKRIIIEIDEKRHHSYDASHHISLIVIRVSYHLAARNLISSMLGCWCERCLTTPRCKSSSD